jgi:putative ABC transport system permease protein
MKFLPLIWAGLRRRPTHPILAFVSMAIATMLAGFAMTAGRVLPHGSGNELDLAVGVISGLGFVMILFLTGNAMAQSVRERGWEFALLRTLGFSRRRVATLLFCEAVAPCLAGAAAGQVLAQSVLLVLSHLFAAKLKMLLLLPLASVGINFASAALVAVVSMILPVRRLAGLNLAATLARGHHG